MGLVGAVPAVPALTVAVLGAAGALAVQPVAAVGAAGDRPGAGAGLGRMALAVQLDHDLGAEGRIVLGTTHPLSQLPASAGTEGELALVKGHKHRVQARGDRSAAALTGGLDSALPDGLRVARRHAKAVAGEGFAQRRPGRPQLLSGGVDAAQPLRKLEGALGLGTVGEEAAGLPAQPVTCCGLQLSSTGFWLGPAAFGRPVPAMLA
jgi:hypothetical protein